MGCIRPLSIGILLLLGVHGFPKQDDNYAYYNEQEYKDDYDYGDDDVPVNDVDGTSDNSLPIHRPVITSESTHLNVDEGMTITLPCNVDKLPGDNSIIWSKEDSDKTIIAMGTMVLHNEYKDRTSVNVNEKGSSLTIGIAKAEDAGTYKCTVAVKNNPPEVKHTVDITEKVERSFFYGPEGGLIRLEERCRVGLNFDISMMIKPRNTSGILVAVKGRRDYLILQMVDGSIQFTVDNGRGPITAIFNPKDLQVPFDLCNGQWHEIHAVKAKNIATLSVNKILGQPGIGVAGVSSTDTNNALFLGGHNRPDRFKLDIKQVNYVGCMKDVVVESNPVDITDDKIIGDIQLDVCPTI